jgi:Zn finger protein HypA/HybF involved in hydrogenase expression
MAAKILIAQARMFSNVFVCRDCNKKIRTQTVRILAGKVKCPRCGKHAFRPIKKK